MNSIASFLNDSPKVNSALYTTRKTTTSAELLSCVDEARSGLLKPLSGFPVTLRCIDIPNYVEALTALDGWASLLLLVDESIDPELLDKFESNLGIVWRVTARADGLEVELIGDAPKPKDQATEWFIPTSGTTGEPKLISHSFLTLTRTVKPPSEASADLRWGLLYSPTRFAGLQVILQALCGGSSLVIPEDPANLSDSMPVLTQHRCNAISATPSLWRKIAFSGLLDSLDLKVVTLGGEAPDQKILDSLRTQFPKATIRHIYASTEAGVGFSVSDCQIGFPATFLARPPHGTELKVDKEGMLFLRHTNPESRVSNEDKWIKSGDLVELRGGRYHFLGRKNGAINVGGQKVHPTAVEAVLLEVTGVLAARVYAKPNPILGSLVATEIVIAPGHDPVDVRKRLMARARESLERYQIPALVLIVDSLNLTPAGKIKR